MQRLLGWLFILLVGASCLQGAPNLFNPLESSTGTFHGCPPTGKGSDPYLNSLKNRDIPPKTARLFTVDTLYKATPVLPRRKIPRSQWTSTQRTIAARWENQAVAVEGYIVHLPVKEGEEACNCKSDQYVDYHMWLGPSPTAARTRAMVVEISPRLWNTHPSWQRASVTLKPLVGTEKVRMTGWLTYDQEHAEQLGKTRRTLWEVHPIHSIQVWRNGAWVSI